VKVEMIRSARSVVSSDSRTAVGAHSNVTRLSRPNAYRENHFAISTSKPAFLPNGGASHLTPMMKRRRSLMFAGSAGSVGFFAAGAVSRADSAGAARLHVAASAAINPNAAVTIASRFIP
jgi:hypothetical protein